MNVLSSPQGTLSFVKTEESLCLGNKNKQAYFVLLSAYIIFAP